jgi:hypothetical protein
LQYFFTSTPHHKVHYVMLAGGTATLPGLKDRVTDLTGFAAMVVNPFEAMQLGGGARGPCAQGGAVLPHGLRPGDAEVHAVILINLLPHREAKRRQRKQAFFVGWPRRRAGAGGCRHLVRRWLQQMTSGQEARNQFLKARSRAWTSRSRTSPRCAPRSTPEGAPEGGGRPADRPQHPGAAAR